MIAHVLPSLNVTTDAKIFVNTAVKSLPEVEAASGISATFAENLRKTRKKKQGYFTSTLSSVNPLTV